MPEILSGLEAKPLIAQLTSHLSPSDARLLAQLADLLPEPPQDPHITVSQVLDQLFTNRDRKAGVDALDKLARRLGEAAATAQVSLALERRGAKNLGLERKVCFTGELPMPTAAMGAWERHASTMVDVRGIPKDRIAIVLTVNSNESTSLLKVFLDKGGAGTVIERGQAIYRDMGNHGQYHVIHATCQAGSATPGGALVVVLEALRNWNPEVVLAIGCAFGIDSNKQAIGDVLVARQLLPYESAAIRDGKYQPRGGQFPASAGWLNRLNTMDTQNKHLQVKDWPRLHPGVVLSGEKLVDDSQFKQILTSLGNQIVGGEMEGSGLYSAIHAANPKPEWLLLKGISDWGEGKHARTPEEKERENEYQRQASTAAARVARALLTLGSGKPEILEDVEDRNPTFKSRELEKNQDRLIALKGQATSLNKHHSSLHEDEDTRPTHGSDESTVDAMAYILSWLNAEQSPPLFALLGEYGMGKTLLCMRVAQEVPQQTTQTIKRQVLYFDLRDALRIAPQIPTLDQIISECSSRGYASNDHPPTPKDVRKWYQQGALVIFDGLDEVLVHLDAAQGQSFTRGLLGLVEAKAKGRVLVSCRTHFFRTLREQTTHFMLEDRGQPDDKAFAALTLQPLNEEQIREYLGKALPSANVDSLIEMVDKVHNLPELAARPYTLSLIAALLPRMEQRLAKGEPVQGVTLYREVVRSWLERDNSKHHLKIEHKLLLARHLAAELWRSRQRSMAVNALETWFGRWLAADADLQRRYRHITPDKLEEDLRNSTFMVRQDGGEAHEGQFRFAHTSLQEFFLAEYLLEGLRNGQKAYWHGLKPSQESWDFVGQMLLEEKKDEKNRLLGILTEWAKADDGIENISSTLISQTALNGLNTLPAVPVVVLTYSGCALKANLPVPSLADIQLGAAQLQGLSLHGPVNGGFPMQKAQFTGANLRECEFSHLDLRQANFSQTDLRWAVFEHCQLNHSVWQAAKTTGLRLRHCVLEGAQFDLDANTGMQWLMCTGLPGEEQVPDGTQIAPLSGGQVTGGVVLAAMHTDTVMDITYSSDGAYFLTASNDHTLKLWQVDTGECLRTFAGHEDGVNACAFSPDGKHIVSASDDHTLILWQADTGECLRSFFGHKHRVFACAFSPDGKHIVSASDDNTLKLLQADTGECLRTFAGHGAWVRACAFSPDGKRIVSASGDSTLKLWQADTGECLRTFAGHEDEVNACAFSPDGKYIVSTSHDKTLKLWQADTGVCLSTLAGHEDWVKACALSPDGKHIVSASSDRTLKLWQADTGECLRTFLGHEEVVSACAFSPDGKHIVSASGYSTLKLWQADTGECLRTFAAHDDWFFKGSSFSSGGKYIVSASEDNTLKIWWVDTGEYLSCLVGHEKSVSSWAFSPNEKHIISASRDKTLKLWQTETGQCLRTFVGHKDWVTTCLFSPDGKHIVSGSKDNTLKLWQTDTGECLHTFVGNTYLGEVCAFSPDGQHIVSVSFDTLKLWQADTGDCQHTFVGNTYLGRVCAFSPDGQHIVFVSFDTLKLWQVDTGECLHTFVGHEDEVLSFAFSPNGKYIVSASWDYTLKLWQADTRECLHTFLGHKSLVFSCAFSPDGKHIVSASNDKTLKLWQADTGECLRTFVGHQNGVFACVFLPDGKHIVSTSYNGTMKLWQTDTGECLRTHFHCQDGHAVIDHQQQKVLEATGSAWRYIGWQTTDANGRPVLLPMESFGPIPEPKAQALQEQH